MGEHVDVTSTAERCDDRCPHYWRELHESRPQCVHPARLVPIRMLFTSAPRPSWCPLRAGTEAEKIERSAVLGACSLCGEGYHLPSDPGAHMQRWPRWETHCHTCAHFLRVREECGASGFVAAAPIANTPFRGAVAGPSGRTMYSIGEEPRAGTPLHCLGFGGAPFRVRFSDGRVVETRNLWSAGPIPMCIAEHFPITAELESIR